jgi:hypothetical protein
MSGDGDAWGDSRFRMTDSTAPSCERHSGFQRADSRRDARGRFPIPEGRFKKSAAPTLKPNPAWGGSSRNWITLSSDACRGGPRCPPKWGPSRRVLICPATLGTFRIPEGRLKKGPRGENDSRFQRADSRRAQRTPGNPIPHRARALETVLRLGPTLVGGGPVCPPRRGPGMGR